MATSEVELLNKVRDDFMSNRAKQEVKIANWAERLCKVDPEVLKDIKLPGVVSLQTLIPELYKDEPDAVVYKQQWVDCNNLLRQVNDLADEWNKEGQRCLLEYQEIASN